MGLVKKQYDDFIFELKYRPTDVDELILPAGMKAGFKKIVALGKVPNMLFSGPAGTGKTSTAFALADEMGLSAMYMNMSLETSIENIRNKLTGFATSISMDGSQKVIIGDEMDRLSAAAMDSLKGVIEQCSKNCKFIFTSNHKGKIIDPIISRCQEIDFTFRKKDVPAMKKEMWMTCCNILVKEEITFDKKAVAEIVKLHFPDMRKIMNTLQMIGLRGDVNMDAVDAAASTDVEAFFQIARDRDWPSMKRYIMDMPIPWDDFYIVIYDNIERYVDESNLSAAIVTIAKYQFESSFIVDKQIPLSALAMELMSMDFKKDF